MRPLRVSRGGRRRFITTTSRRLHSPLAMVLSKLRAMRGSRSSARQRRFLSLVQRRKLHVRRLVTSVLLLTGTSTHKVSLRVGSTTPSSLLLYICRGCRGLTTSGKVSLRFSLKSTTCHSYTLSTRHVARILSVLVSGTLSCAPRKKGVLLLLSRSTRRAVFTITSGKSSVPRRRGTRVFRHFCHASRTRASRGRFNLNLYATRRVTRTRRKGVLMRSPYSYSLLPRNFPQSQNIIFAIMLRKWASGVLFYFIATNGSRPIQSGVAKRPRQRVVARSVRAQGTFFSLLCPLFHCFYNEA